MEVTDPLQDVPVEDIPDMLFRLRNNFPLAIHAHEFLQTILKWKRKNPDFQVAILAPSGNYKLGIIFYIIIGMVAGVDDRWVLRLNLWINKQTISDGMMGSKTRILGL
ncbi:uncharacterized protein [Halyomorpha halys]|uniref:uncharacterized protein n=1 Tax=Halyomorpha halys TaxID=286706 RepID=UPI000D0C7BDA|nr:uncharacterized protein LOC112211526 [Halyomorpha halys]